MIDRSCFVVIATVRLTGLWSVFFAITATVRSDDTASRPIPPRDTAAAATSTLPPQTLMIDEAISRTWDDYEIKPAEPADDATWCRRVHLDLIGRIPTVDELTAYVKDKSSDKRATLVAKLLHDDAYTSQYAAHWSSYWSNLLVGRGGVDDDNAALVDRDGMAKYLRDAMADDLPYDRMVLELVTATGTTKPGTKDFNGAVNFLIDKVNEEKATLATSSVSRIFLGQQVQCTQCHNHPFNQWKQQKFWEFNAFFRQTRALRRYVNGTNDIDHAELVDEDFAGEADNAADALIFYELRNGLTKVAYPAFTDGTTIDVSGYVSDVNRRQELGRLMLQSEFLDKMIVNRMWSQLMGYGFTRPIDDLGPHNPPTHPELLSGLAAEFRGGGYRLKDLLTWIALSRPYQLSADTNKHNQIDDPSAGETPKFSRFYTRQMTAEQLYQSLLTASDAAPDGTYQQQEQQRREWLQQFVVAFGTDEGDEATTFNGSIPQALMLFNGELTKNATNTDAGSFLDRVNQSASSSKAAVATLFLAGVARRPTQQELMVAAKLMQARGGDQLAMLQDMWWAILNSNEFIMQH